MSGLSGLAQLVAGAALGGSCAAFLVACAPELRIRGAKRLARRLAPICLAIALVALALSLVGRGAAAQRWPVGTLYEFTLLFAFFLLAAHAVLQRQAPPPHLGAAISILALALLVGAHLTQPTSPDIQSLPPVMQGLWFPLHTLLLALSCGLLGLTGSAAALQLGAPELQLSSSVDWSMNLGYVALGLGMIAGAVWGEQAWGDFWTWSVKEVWTLATWWVCTIYLHLRHHRGWRGKRALWVAALAFGFALTTVYFTPWLVRWTRLTELPIY